MNIHFNNLRSLKYRLSWVQEVLIEYFKTFFNFFIMSVYFLGFFNTLHFFLSMNSWYYLHQDHDSDEFTNLFIFIYKKRPYTKPISYHGVYKDLTYILAEYHRFSYFFKDNKYYIKLLLNLYLFTFKILVIFLLLLAYFLIYYMF